MKKFDKKHFIAIGITVIFALCGFIYSTAILRFFESLKDVGLSIAYYFIEIFSMLTGGENFITPGVINVSEVVNINTAFPLLWDDFAAKMSVFWQQLTNADNFASYLSSINQILFTFLLVVLLVLPFAVLFYFTAKWLLVSHSKRNAGENSKPLRLFLKLEKKTAPFFDCIKAFAKFVKNNKIYCRLWLIIWLLNLNVLSVIFEAAAYLIYFISSFDVTNVYLQVYKLSMDVALMTNSLPVFVWIVICYVVIDKLRKKIGLNRLHRYENRNKGFINSLNLVIMITGSMGSKKTTTLTDIMLSQEAIFRDKAFDLLKENDMKFPLFPWAVFEKELNKVISYGQIFNLTTCRSWVNKKRIRFEKSPSPEKLFGYDFSVHPLYAAGELKHGTISLVEKGTLVVSVLTQPELFDKMISNMSEVKSRGGYVMGLTGKGNYEIEDTADFTVYIPQTDPRFTAALAAVPLQLMGYYISVAKGIDVDKPRNLAKSVTVE